ncbi:MAG: formimidoylglutamase [Bacteroidota bacterium]|nr:formimidoylglutamase [Bacteroidota bacterium]
MDDLKQYSKDNINSLIRKRQNETKIGETIHFCQSDFKTELQNKKVRFVIIGIPEDIGVRANYGRGGANTAFKPALESFLNTQENDFLKGESVFLAGEIHVDDLTKKSLLLNTKNKEELKELREQVTEIDKRVTNIIKQIVEANKIPIIIGGGHNNAYGNIKGSSLALNKKINVINCDPHLDFRPTEGRHSGNGFSYAFEENYLEKYSVFAMHEQYNSQHSIKQFKKNADQLFFNTYESIFVREEVDIKVALHQSIGFVKNNTCGIELDLDSITNVPTSAKTSSGISPLQARQFVHQCASQLSCVYLHIAEGAPILSHIKADNKTGKLISYLICDFIKAITAKNL